MNDRGDDGAGAPGRRCEATTTAGGPCRAHPNFVDPETGLCPAHDPERREEFVEAGRKGGEATRRAWATAKGLDPDTLPPLTSRSDALRWLAVTTEAVATGALTAAEGETLRALVGDFLAALGPDSGPSDLEAYLRDRYGDEEEAE